MGKKAAISILAVGVSPELLGALDGNDKILSQHSPTRLAADFAILLEPLPAAPDLVICGAAPEAVSAFELAQMLRMQHMDAPILYISPSRGDYDRKSLIGNGFTDVFLLPMDLVVFRQSLKDFLSQLSDGEIKSYRPVKLIEIQPGTVLDFDTSIYMPVNNKYIRYSAAGDPIDPERAEQLAKHKVSAIFVNTAEIQKFYDYTAKQLQVLGATTELGPTEKAARMQGLVRELMGGLFNDTSKDSTFEQGKSVIKDCQEIVKAYVINSSSGPWYQRLLTLSSEQGSSYAHATSVSAYAALFSMALGVGLPEELALAGMLHDVGLADVPFAIQSKSEKDRTSDEWSVYKRHPEFSTNILARKKLLLPPKVAKAILQHHECYNGSGYPRGISEDRILPEAQVLGLANYFDDLTIMKEGRPRVSPLDALETLKKQLAQGPKACLFNPKYISGLIDLFKPT